MPEALLTAAVPANLMGSGDWAVPAPHVRQAAEAEGKTHG